MMIPRISRNWFRINESSMLLNVRSIGNSFRINTGETQARCLHHNARVRVQEPQRRLVRAGLSPVEPRLSPRAARVAPAAELANARQLNDTGSACKFRGIAEPQALKR